MANPEHVKILKQGVKVWNKWREEKDLIPELDGTDLRGMKLQGANFSWAELNRTNLFEANLEGANLNEAHLSWAELINTNLRRTNLRSTNLSWSTFIFADLKGAELNEATLMRADLRYANLTEANLSKANLSEATLNNAILTNAILTKADLNRASLVDTNIEGADLSNSRVYGASVWNLRTNEETTQLNLVITQESEPVITVDNLEVAQFMYLLLNNRKIRHVIDTITSKVVLVLGRFTDERKAVLDAISDELRRRDYLPVVFDFNKPASRDLTETISTLAHMARFIIADITDAKSIPQELQAVVPNLPSVPVQPLLFGSSTEYGMFEHFRRYHWVLPICRYNDPAELIQSIQTKVIAPAEEMVKRAGDQKPSCG